MSRTGWTVLEPDIVLRILLQFPILKVFNWILPRYSVTSVIDKESDWLKSLCCLFMEDESVWVKAESDQTVQQAREQAMGEHFLLIYLLWK